MSRMEPHERPSAQQLAAGSTGQSSFAGKPANVCPHCGCAMFAYRTTALETRIIRYEHCRNCGKRFVTRQAQSEIVREVSPSEISD